MKFRLLMLLSLFMECLCMALQTLAMIVMSYELLSLILILIFSNHCFVGVY